VFNIVEMTLISGKFILFKPKIKFATAHNRNARALILQFVGLHTPRKFLKNGFKPWEITSYPTPWGNKLDDIIWKTNNPSYKEPMKPYFI